MAPTITWSTTLSGASITEQDLDDIANGVDGAAHDIYIRHSDLSNPITLAKLYISAPIREVYEGTEDGHTDFSEMIAWGDATTSTGFGGIQIKFTGSNWPTYLLKDRDPGADAAYTIRTGKGDSSANAIIIPLEAIGDGTGVDGTIAVGESNTRFQIKVVVPSDEDTTGIRQIQLNLVFSYT